MIYIYSQIIYTILYTHIFNIPQLQVTKQKRAGNFKEPPTEWEPLISGQARNKSAGHQPQKDGRGFFPRARWIFNDLYDQKLIRKL